MMKPWWLASALLLANVSAAQGPKALREEFRNPSLRYRMNVNRHSVPREERAQDSMIRWILDNGYRGMATNVNPDGYLRSDDELAVFNRFVHAAKKQGLDLWLYDERSYPSGMAHTYVLEGHPEWEAEGLLFRDLLRRMEQSGVVDAVGLNCVSAPGAMKKLVQSLGETLLPLSVMPNAGYPVVTRARVLYQGKPAYFAREMGQIAAAGVRILGGCCGTTPAHIAALCAELDALPQQTEAAPAAKLSTGTAPAVEKDDAFLRKLNAGEKVIAIELDSPRVADLSGYLDGARRLQAAGADLLTIADCPIAQARMDSSLVACRVHRELGLCTLPHMTCRDRNLNATKALLLGLYAEGVREVLAITGDPIPTAERDEVKNVYQFNSRKLAQYIVSLAGEGREMPSPLTVFGALNLNARNFDVELRRAKEKLENGMSGFLTQPVLSAQAVENLKKSRETLGADAKILAGIMPVVSQRNAIFMENEINGIHVEEDIIQRFAGLDREQGEALGLEVSMQMAREALPYADGFYLMTPFNRVALMERLIARLKTELLDAEG